METTWRTVGEERLNDVGYGIWPRAVVDAETRSRRMAEVGGHKARSTPYTTCKRCGRRFKAGTGIARHKRMTHGG